VLVLNSNLNLNSNRFEVFRNRIEKWKEKETKPNPALSPIQPKTQFVHSAQPAAASVRPRVRVRPLPSGPLLSAPFPAAHASPSHCSAGPTCHLPPLALPQRPSVIPAANLATAFQTRTPKSPAPPFKPSPQPPAPPSRRATAAQTLARRLHLAPPHRDSAHCRDWSPTVDRRPR